MVLNIFHIYKRPKLTTDFFYGKREKGETTKSQASRISIMASFTKRDAVSWTQFFITLPFHNYGITIPTSRGKVTERNRLGNKINNKCCNSIQTPNVRGIFFPFPRKTAKSRFDKRGRTGELRGKRTHTRESTIFWPIWEDIVQNLLVNRILNITLRKRSVKNPSLDQYEKHGFFSKETVLAGSYR